VKVTDAGVSEEYVVVEASGLAFAGGWVSSTETGESGIAGEVDRGVEAAEQGCTFFSIGGGRLWSPSKELFPSAICLARYNEKISCRRRCHSQNARLSGVAWNFSDLSVRCSDSEGKKEKQRVLLSFGLEQA
jgi:hypothetical protein